MATKNKFPETMEKSSSDSGSNQSHLVQKLTCIDPGFPSSANFYCTLKLAYNNEQNILKISQQDCK